MRSIADMYRISRFIWLLAVGGRPDIRRAGSKVFALRISDARAQMRQLARGGTVRSGPIIGNLPTAVDFRGAVFRPMRVNLEISPPACKAMVGRIQRAMRYQIWVYPASAKVRDRSSIRASARCIGRSIRPLIRRTPEPEGCIRRYARNGIGRIF